MKDNTPKKILFIQSGIPFYYPMIEEAILNSLQKVNSNTIMVNPERAIETALKIKPDFILVLGGLNEGIISVMPVLKSAGFTTGLWLTDDPYYTDVTQHLVPHYDYIFTQDLNCIKFYRGLGCKNVFHLPLAANQDVFKPSQKEDTYKYDLSFIGTAFENRLTFVDSISEYLAEKNIKIVGFGWENLKNYGRLKDKIQLLPLAKYEDALQFYVSTKININLHRSPNDKELNCNAANIQAYSVNNRTFEINAVGSFQLTDIRPDVGKHYIPGVEIETFNSASEFIEKAEYYLEHVQERKQIAKNGLDRTLKHHTYDKRIVQLLNYIHFIGVKM
ncbi:glycosyltransferase [Bacillus pacificus]|uniref:CgeB family protein n=1 Tax=Bacillus cereus group TaxID=86661 RepID=UPI000935D6B7|nr:MULTISPECIES: glycosyltransferase [Bacillus cereus group]ASI78505.1 spore maturation protein [Bacillus cereus]MCC2484347.1 glycosyltransferase [Bacillus pacificus]MDA1605741.1 glycosyltransferase [Bacillus cereus group sp. TH208-1LC]MED1651745.1 glycosyltransferase [Bacillus pacificus]HDR7487596.1 glycosyltransferase [Bacillus pacificus]